MTVRLIPQDAALLESLRSAEAFDKRYSADIAGHLDLARDVVRQTLDLAELTGAGLPWTGYLAADTGSNEVIGSCGFKGGPAEDGSVEIAYFTFPPHEGKGYATEMAKELLRIARDSAEVRTVVAHTLPEENASTRILRKAGFDHLGEVVDPEDGVIWRWSRE